MYNQVEKNPIGYYQLKETPTQKELENYYAQQYFQSEKGAYSKYYSDVELLYFRNKIEQKYQIINAHLSTEGKPKSMLDIGTGEGFAMKFFCENGWDVTGLDYSSYGLEQINPVLLPFLKVGDLNEQIERYIDEGVTFDVLWMINLLEHVIDPQFLLMQCSRLLNKGGVLVIEVPNDFSRVQSDAFAMQLIEEPYWVVSPDHISYFSVDSLSNLLIHCDWSVLDIITDFPIDWNIYNPNTNYIMDKVKGKSVHLSRIHLENLMHSISIEGTNHLYRSMAKLGLGRQINGFFTI